MKKLPVLHIMNGDASLPAFKTAKIPGQVLVWREVLSEGPAIANVPDHIFWEKRQTYITDTYGETAAAYKQKVLDELPKLDAAGGFFEVVLWFDADLMCQVNLLYLLHRMHQLQPTMVFTCTPPLPDYIGMLKPEALQQLYENRQQQTPSELEQAHALWQLYAGPDPMALQHYLQQQTAIPPHIRQAMALHLSRFPDCHTGLSQPEKALLVLIKEGAHTKEQLMQQFWKLYPLYGFGDWQLLQLLQNLQPELVQDSDQLTFTSKGIKVLTGDSKHKQKDYWLGGVKVDAANKLCYNSIENELKFTF